MKGIARMHAMRNKSISYTEKSAILDEETYYNTMIMECNIADKNGILYLGDGSTRNITGLDWYKKMNDSQVYMSEPYMSTIYNKMVIAVAVPVLDNNKKYLATLVAVIDGYKLCDFV